MKCMRVNGWILKVVKICILFVQVVNRVAGRKISETRSKKGVELGYFLRIGICKSFP